MNILVANDDGIKARGIKELVRALSTVANVYVCAPHKQRSASGHSISINKPLKVKEVKFPYSELALEMNGTPADCVKVGLKILKDQQIEIDMIFSGINHGGNLGTDTLYSGTVSAAIEGALCKKPSVAVSLNNNNPKHFQLACELAVKCAVKAFGKLDNTKVLNINVPDLPKKEIKGVKYTRLGVREYDEWLEPVECDNGEIAYMYGGQAKYYTDMPSDIDIISMQEGYASITPLQYDLTSYQLIEEVKNWRIEE